MLAVVAVVLLVGYFVGSHYPQFGQQAIAKVKGATGL